MKMDRAVSKISAANIPLKTTVFRAVLRQCLVWDPTSNLKKPMMKWTAAERNSDALMTKAEKKRRRTESQKRKVTCFFHVVQFMTLALCEEQFASLNAAGHARTNYEKPSKYAEESKIWNCTRLGKTG